MPTTAISLSLLKLLDPFAIADPIWVSRDNPLRQVQLDLSSVTIGTKRLWSTPDVDGELAVVPGILSRGSVLYRGASGWQSLSPGAVGQVLKSQGPNADPVWGAGGGSGGGGVSAPVTANLLVGDGLGGIADSGLTITGGRLSDSSLSSNVPLKGGNNTYTGTLDMSAATVVLPSTFTLQLRRGLFAELQTTVLGNGEPGYITDTREIVVGDGTTAGARKVGLRRAVFTNRAAYQPVTATGSGQPDAILGNFAASKNTQLLLAYAPDYYIPAIDVSAGLGVFNPPTSKPGIFCSIVMSNNGVASSVGLAGKGGIMFTFPAITITGGNGGNSSNNADGGNGGDICFRSSNRLTMSAGNGGDATNVAGGGRGGDSGFGANCSGGAGGAGGTASNATGGEGGGGGASKWSYGGVFHSYLSGSGYPKGGSAATNFSPTAISPLNACLLLRGGTGGDGSSTAGARGGDGGCCGKFASDGGNGAAGTTVAGGKGGSGGWLVLSGGNASAAFNGGEGGGLWLSGADSDGVSSGGRGGYIGLNGSPGLNAPDIQNITAFSTPEGNFAATYGSLALVQWNNSGRVFIKQSGAGNTGWCPAGVRVAVPSTSGTFGLEGQWAADDSFFYYYAATAWRRIAGNLF